MKFKKNIHVLYEHAKNYIKHSIARELFYGIALSLVISGSVFAILSISMHQFHILRQQHKDYTYSRAKTLDEVKTYGEALSTANPDTYSDLIEHADKYLKGEIHITDASGNSIYASSDQPINIAEWISNANNETKDECYYLCHPYMHPGDIHYILLFTDLGERYSYSDEWIFLTSGILSLLIFFTAIFLLIKRKINYIESIGQSVQQIKEGNLNTSVPLSGDDELFRIAISLNEMEHNIDELIRKDKEYNEHKISLITAMAHDIKTPVTIILGYLDIVLHNKCDSESNKYIYLQKAYDKADTLREMSIRLFETAQADSFYSNDKVQEIHFTRMVNQVISEYEVLIEDKALHLQYDIGETKPLMANAEQLHTVLTNIFDNALKYCLADGSIKVSLASVENDIVLSISNSSSYISEIECENIFKEFYRMDQSRNSSIPGNGLGLYLVKKIIAEQHGAVWCSYNNNFFTINIKL